MVLIDAYCKLMVNFDQTKRVNDKINMKFIEINQTVKWTTKMSRNTVEPIYAISDLIVNSYLMAACQVWINDVAYTRITFITYNEYCIS